MRELYFKCIYNGINSFADLIQSVDGDVEDRIDKLNERWQSGWIEIEGRDRISITQEILFMYVCCEVKAILWERKNVLVEIYLATENSS